MALESTNKPYEALRFFRYKQHGESKTVKVHEYVRAFATQLHSMKNSRVFVAITVTYKPKANGKATVDEIRKIFHQFYWENFLPGFIFESAKWLKQSKGKQPILYLFPEAHMTKPKCEFAPDGRMKYIYPERFHHHAFMALHPAHLNLIEKLEGEDTLKQFHDRIMTSCVKLCSLDWIYYAGKNLSDNFEGMTPYGASEIFDEMASADMSALNLNQADLQKMYELIAPELRRYADWDLGTSSRDKSIDEDLLQEFIELMEQFDLKETASGVLTPI